VLNGCSAIYKTNSYLSNSQAFGKSYSLPKGLLVVSAERKEKAGEIKVEVSPLIVPDEHKKYFLQYERNVMFTENIVIQTDQNGLLSAINTTTTDETPNIVAKLGELAGEAAKLATAGRRGSQKEDKICEDDGSPFSLTTFIDPYEKNSADVIVSQDRCIFLTVPRELRVDQRSSAYLEGVAEYSANVEKGFIYYRDMRMYKFNMKIGSNVEKEFSLALPDLNALGRISIDRGLFVERKVDLTFTSGTLTKIDAKFPSEVLGFVSLPLALVKGVSNAIVGQFGLKIDYLKNKTDLAESELKTLKAKSDLESAKK
jgi:hypothetical protein